MCTSTCLSSEEADERTYTEREREGERGRERERVEGRERESGRKTELKRAYLEINSIGYYTKYNIKLQVVD